MIFTPIDKRKSQEELDERRRLREEREREQNKKRNEEEHERFHKHVQFVKDQLQHNKEIQREIAKQAYLEAFREFEAEKQAKIVPPQTKAGANKSKTKSEPPNQSRTAHVKEWAARTQYTGGKSDKAINTELKADMPDLWDDTMHTFRKWIQSDEALDAKVLLPNKRRK